MKSRGLLDPNHRILVIDDNQAIHDDLRKILLGEVKTQEHLRDDESFLFAVETVPITRFEIRLGIPGPRRFGETPAVAGRRPSLRAGVCGYTDAPRMGWRGNHHSPVAHVSEPAG